MLGVLGLPVTRGGTDAEALGVGGAKQVAGHLLTARSYRSRGGTAAAPTSTTAPAGLRRAAPPADVDGVTLENGESGQPRRGMGPGPHLNMLVTEKRVQPASQYQTASDL